MLTVFSVRAGSEPTTAIAIVFVPGRSGAFFDVLVDTAGAVNGVLLMTGLSAVRDANRLVKRTPDGSGAS